MLSLRHTVSLSIHCSIVGISACCNNRSAICANLSIRASRSLTICSSIQINFFIVFLLRFNDLCQSRYKSRSTSSSDEICPLVTSYCFLSTVSVSESPYSQAKVFRAVSNPARSGRRGGFGRNRPRPGPCGIAPENLAGFPARPFKPACTGTPAPKCRTNENQVLCYRQEPQPTTCNRCCR